MWYLLTKHCWYVTTAIPCIDLTIQCIDLTINIECTTNYHQPYNVQTGKIEYTANHHHSAIQCIDLSSKCSI